MNYPSGTKGYTIDSDASFYAVVVHGTSDGHVDLPAAIKAGALVGILQPKQNASSATSGNQVDIQREGISRYNKATGYTVSKGDLLGVYDANGNLAPVGDLSVSAGTNIEVMGTAEIASASADTQGVIHLSHMSYQG